MLVRRLDQLVKRAWWSSEWNVSFWPKPDAPELLLERPLSGA